MYRLTEELFNFLYARGVLQAKGRRLGYRGMHSAAIFQDTEYLLEEYSDESGEEAAGEYMLSPLRQVIVGEGLTIRIILTDSTEETVSEQGSILPPKGMLERLENAAHIFSLSELIEKEPGLRNYFDAKRAFN